MTENCPACGTEFNEATATGLCPACDATEGVSKPKPILAIGAVAVACVPLTASFTSSSTSSITVDGVTTESASAIDYVAVGAGALGVLLGLAALAVYAKKKSGLGMGLGALALLIGGYHVARGLFLF